MNNRMRTAAVVLAVLGVLLCGLMLAGQLLYSYYLLRPWLHHTLVFGVSAAAAFAMAWGLGIKPHVLRWVGVVLFASMGAGAAGLAWFVSLFHQDLVELSRYSAPDGSMELIIYEGYNWIDPFWELRMRTKNGMLSRESDLGCINGDFMSLTKIDWTGPRTVRAYLSSGETVDIRLNEKGRPDRKVEGGC